MHHLSLKFGLQIRLLLYNSYLSLFPATHYTAVLNDGLVTTVDTPSPDPSLGRLLGGLRLSSQVISDASGIQELVFPLPPQTAENSYAWNSEGDWSVGGSLCSKRQSFCIIRLLPHVWGSPAHCPFYIVWLFATFCLSCPSSVIYTKFLSIKEGKNWIHTDIAPKSDKFLSWNRTVLPKRIQLLLATIFCMMTFSLNITLFGVRAVPLIGARQKTEQSSDVQRTLQA